MPEKPEVQARREVTFKVIVNQPGEPALATALPQFAKAFSLPEDAAAQILSAAPIVLMTGLTKNEAKLLKPVLIKLSSAGMEFKITVIPDKGIPYVIWPFKPHITPKGIEETIPGIAFEWRNTAVVCPSCGETFAIKPIGKTQQAKPVSIQAAIAQAETPARQDETVRAPAVKPKPTAVKPQAQKPAPPQELEPEPEEAEIAESGEEAVEATADEPLEVAELTDEQQAEEASAEAEPAEEAEAVEEAQEAEPAEEAEAVEEAESAEEAEAVEEKEESPEEIEEAAAVPVEVASDDTAYEEQPPQQFSGEDLIVMDDAPVIIDVPEEQVPQASPYYIKQEEPEPTDATPVEPQAPVIEESAMEAEQLEVVEEEPQAAVKPTVRQKPANVPLKKGPAVKPPAGRPQQASAVSYSVFLDKIVNPSKRTQSAELLSEMTGISVEEANGIVNRSVVPVLKNVPQAEAQDCLNKFNAIGVKGRITSNAKK